MRPTRPPSSRRPRYPPRLDRLSSSPPPCHFGGRCARPCRRGASRPHRTVPESQPGRGVHGYPVHDPVGLRVDPEHDVARPPLGGWSHLGVAGGDPHGARPERYLRIYIPKILDRDRCHHLASPRVQPQEERFGAPPGPPPEVATSSSVRGSSPTKSVWGGATGPAPAPAAPGGEAPGAEVLGGGVGGAGDAPGEALAVGSGMALAEGLAEALSLLASPIAHKEPSPKPAGRPAWPRGDTTCASKPTGSWAVWAFDRSPSGAVVSSLVAVAPRLPPRPSLIPGSPTAQPTTKTAITKVLTTAMRWTWRITTPSPSLRMGPLLVDLAGAHEPHHHQQGRRHR